MDSSTIYKNWNKYKDENGDGICRNSFADEYTPDLLIIKDWKLFAKEKSAPSIIIEVKRPTASDRKHAENEIKEYLGKANHVILTDSITWEFYNKEDNIAVEFYLANNEKKVCKRGLSANREIEWKDEDVLPKIKEKINCILKQNAQLNLPNS